MHRLYFHTMIFTNGERKMFKKIVLFFVLVFCLSGFVLAQGGGSGKGTGGFGKCTESDKFTDKNNQTFAILSKPRAGYTDAARMNNVTGTIKLSVTFLKTGKIGKIKVINALPDGLTQQTINAAKKICFRPMIVNGEAKDVVRELSYSFTIY